MDNIIAFQKWLDSDTKSYDEGLLLSTFRKQELLRLFQSNPEKAWSYHLKKSELKDIHPDILNNIEDYINDKGDILIYKECECHSDEIKRTLKYKDKYYTAFTWGKRAAILSKKDIPFHAITLDNKAVIYKKSFTCKKEVDAQLAIDPNFEVNIVKKEISKSFDSFADAPAPTSWTTGNKRVLYIRARFQGESGEVVSLAQAKQSTDDTINFYKLNSRNKLNLSFTFTDVIDLSQGGGAYSFESIMDEAANVARSKNSQWNASDYDFYIVVTSNPGQFGYAGRAWIGGPGHHLISQYAILRVTAHELGHNLGLFHASFWYVTNGMDKNPMGSGYVQGYGHNYSIMNGKYDAEFYDYTKPFLAPAELEHLNWASAAQGDFATVGDNEDKLIKIYGLEYNNGVRAIKILKKIAAENDMPSYYWLCFRHHFNDNSRVGAQLDIAAEYYGNGFIYGVVQLDVAREGTEWQDHDRLIKVGRTYFDEKNKIKVTVTKIDNSAENPYIEVSVKTGNKVDTTTPPPPPPPPPPVDPEPPANPIVDANIDSIKVQGENSAAKEIAINLLDGKTNTKWLDFSQNSWFEIKYKNDFTLNSFILTSANDEPNRDPHTVSLSVSGQKIADYTGLKWNSRFENKTFVVPSGAPYGNTYKFNLTSNASITQLAGFSSTVSIPPTPPPPPPEPELVKKEYNPTDDVYVDETSPRAVLGQKWELFAKAENKYRRISYLSFVVDPVNKVEKAILSLQARIDRKDYKQSLKLNIRDSDYGWKEDKLTWTNKPRIGEKITDFTLLTPSKQVYAIDLTEYVNNKLALGIYYFSIVIEADRAIEYIAKIDSQESANPPVLSLEYYI